MRENVGTKCGYENIDAETRKRIADRRKQLNITQSQLAKKLGYTSRSYIARVESGSLPLSAHKLEKWAIHLKTTQEYLLHLTDDVNGTATDADKEDPVDESIQYYMSIMNRKEKRMLLDFAEQIIKYRE